MDLFNIRKDFYQKNLDSSDAKAHPIAMLRQWLQEAIDSQALEPTAMTLSTVGNDGKPSSRVVLLKELKDSGLVFFTNYNSKKGLQMASNNYVAISLIWHELERQVRIEGAVEKIDESESDTYFNMRPLGSRIGAWASPQSQVIPNREYLDNEIVRYKKEFSQTDTPRPPHWGGYLLKPTLVEFWQGRASRLHDRLQYRLDDGTWILERLAP